eukprot:COSAG02_NODE_31039_length_540_cov_1.117914_1_plen_159_part_00
MRQASVDDFTSSHACARSARTPAPRKDKAIASNCAAAVSAFSENLADRSSKARGRRKDFGTGCAISQELLLTLLPPPRSLLQLLTASAAGRWLSRNAVSHCSRAVPSSTARTPSTSTALRQFARDCDARMPRAVKSSLPVSRELSPIVLPNLSVSSAC